MFRSPASGSAVIASLALTLSSSRNSGATTHVGTGQDGAFRRCCRRTARFDELAATLARPLINAAMSCEMTASSARCGPGALATAPQPCMAATKPVGCRISGGVV
jgi:hypothetical protein